MEAKSNELPKECYLCRRLVKSYTDLQKVNQIKLQQWAMLKIGRHIKVKAYSCWTCIKDAKYCNDKEGKNIKQDWWDGLKNIPEETTDDSSDGDEDSVLPNRFTKNVKVHLKRLSEKAIKSAKAPTKERKKKLKKCPECSEQFMWRPPLMKHIKENHPELTICAFCNSVFTKESDFKTHSLECKKPEGHVQCAKCNLLCRTEKLLAVHDMMKHQPITCTICKKSVGNKLNFLAHEKKCKGIKEVN